MNPVNRVPSEPRKPPPLRRVPSLVLVNTGYGKGKSTAAFGTAMRAVARGWNVCVIQFLKSGTWRVGEEKVGRDLGIDWWSLGDGFTWNSSDLERTEALAKAAWVAASDKIRSGAYQMIVLDEITYPINGGWVDLDDVLDTVRSRPEGVNLIFTGRDAPEQLVALADTVTEMVKVKHAYDSGVRAKRGIDF